MRYELLLEVGCALMLQAAAREGLDAYIAELRQLRSRDFASGNMSGPGAWGFAVWAWAECGLPRIEMGHKRAAAFAATVARSEDLGDVEMPWPAFMVTYPDGLWNNSPLWTLVGGTSRTDVVARELQVPLKGRPFIMVSMRPDGSMMVDQGHYAGLKGLLDSQVTLGNGDVVDKPSELQCMHRIVIGAALDVLQYRPAAMPYPGIATKRDARTGRPVPTTFVLKGDVRVDCREQVAEWAEGRSHKAPSVRVLVRGHWKRQAHGAGRTERRILFIQPYWRGPDDAPGAIRAHRLEDA